MTTPQSNGKLLLGIWRDSLPVTCGLTACTPGSAPGPTLGNEYGKTLPFLRPKRHLDQFICFSTAHDYLRQTASDHGISVTVDRT